MGSVKKLKQAFEIDVKHGAFFTGGNVEWTSDGSKLLCQCGGAVNVLDVEQGQVISSLGEKEEDLDEDTINTFTLSADNEHLVTSHKSGLFKLWDWRNAVPKKMWKSVHKGPVASLALSYSGGVMVSGGTDSGVRLWDLQKQTCLSSLRGAQGVVSLVEFHPDESRALVFAAADDAAIRAWNVENNQLRLTLSGHFSKVTALVFHPDHNHIVSCGRDKVVILWDISKSKGQLVRTLPAYESLEGLVLLPQEFSLPGVAHNNVKNGIHVATAGESGVIRIWDMNTGKEVYVQQNSLVSKATEEGGLSVIRLLFNEQKRALAIVTVDHNIILHQLTTFDVIKQLVGFSDEILDVVFLGPEDSHIAVATNSTDIKLYRKSDMACQLLKGHSDLVLALATTSSNPHLLLSSGKDNSVRLWLLDSQKQTMLTVGIGCRHTASVGSVALSQLSDSFFLSASQDSCLKMWVMPKDLMPDSVETLTVSHTEVAHNKDINSVCISPNDKLAATGSQDKTAKLWSTDGLALLGVLRGHRRGVWCVRFSPVDQVLLTTSADCTLKLWSLTDLSCLKTFEGHESSVLKAEFVSRGMQLLTAGADGLLKLWTIKSSECITTLEHHEGRVWAMTVSKDEHIIISGGSDSELVQWRDVTEERRQKEEEARQQLALQEQELANLLQSDQLLSALKLALSLDRPLQVLKIVQEILKQGRSGLSETVKHLQADQKEILLRSAASWNTNSRNCHPAQLVLSVLMDDISSGELNLVLLSSTLEGILPYTERHFKRLTQMLQDLHLLQYMTATMQPHST